MKIDPLKLISFLNIIFSLLLSSSEMPEKITNICLENSEPLLIISFLKSSLFKINLYLKSFNIINDFESGISIFF